MISDELKLFLLIALTFGIAYNLVGNRLNKKKYYPAVYNKENEHFYFRDLRCPVSYFQILIILCILG